MATKSIFCIAVTYGLICLCSALIKKCMIEDADKQSCGEPGTPPDYCLANGCCYDDSRPGVPWCYYASTDTFVNGYVLALLARDGVSRDVITALYADTYPGAEWLLAFKDGKLDTKRLLEVIAGDGYSLNPLLAKTLAGKDPLDAVLSQIGDYTGTDLEYFNYLRDGKTDVVVKHIVSILSAQNRNPGLPYNAIASIISGQGLDSNTLISSYVDQLLPRGDQYSNAFYEALLKGETKEAIQWAYLSAFQGRVPAESLYPKNIGLFMSIIMTQKEYPGKLSPSILLAMARGEILPFNTDGYSFEEIFGVDAEDYVCAAHSPNIQTTCEAMRGRYYFSNRDCLDAGCCVQEATAPGENPICFENILGSIGMVLAQTVIDQEYVTNNVLGGFLLDVEEFVPWLPNNNLPDKFIFFQESGKTDFFEYHKATAVPLAPSIFRPNFKWVPHGPTAFPFATRLPQGLLVPTEIPGKLDELYPDDADEPEPLIQISLNRFGTDCLAVRYVDRFECISNSVALYTGGQEACLNAGCCYEPVWSDLRIPACFREVSYGQCYDVPPEEREDCGKPGVSKLECLENPQCCFDSAVSTQSLYEEVPWCYYKKRSPVNDKTTCKRYISPDERVGCFTEDYFNYVVDQATCESIDGCCYEKNTNSWFDRALGAVSDYPTCFRGVVIDLTPTDPAPVDPDVEEVCESRDVLLPHEREDCGPKHWFECVTTEGCCWDPIIGFPGYPWCYYKSLIDITP